jgi:hypothetical protein
MSPHSEEYPVEPPRNVNVNVSVNGNGAVAINQAAYHPEGYVPSIPHHASELDAHYWKNMFLELGFGETQGEQQTRVVLPQAAEQSLPYHMHATQTYGH